MINKVIYIGYQPLTEKVKVDFYFQELIDNNIQINYWDLTEVFFKNLIFKNQLKDDFIIKIDSFDKLKNLLNKQDINSTFFITNITLEYRVLKLFRILSKYKCKTAFFGRGAQPSYTEKSKTEIFKLKLKKIVNFNLVVNFLGNKYTYLLKRTGKINPFFIVFKAGELGLKSIGISHDIDEKFSKIINVNYFDYDKFLCSNNCDRLIKSNYCLYLDEYLPFHPDFQMFNIKTIEYKQFYRSLNNFFSFIENKYNIEVVIAAHPKAEKYKQINYFEGRKIFFNKSSELTKDAEFVLSHNSSSLSFAVLNLKPIILLYNDSIKQIMPNTYNVIINYFKALGVNCVNFEEEFGDININKPDEFKYSDFRYKYLTSKVSENRLSSEIFVETILSM